mmetsp:Transcript_25248/g.80262  ORF Transcript_25248/g.80262 Transcript_25248/m.80262 type:complete len:365 (-) Transcript_25248:67-1161(-)
MLTAPERREQDPGQSLRPRVVGGDAASISSFPFFAALVEPGEGNTVRSFCGGALLSRTSVVTAAHCVTNSASGTVRVPSFVQFEDDNIDSASGRLVAVQSVTVHPDFIFQHFVNDIAVLHLVEPYLAADPISLPPSNYLPGTGEQLTAIGFGLLQDLGPRPTDYYHFDETAFFPCSSCGIPCQDDKLSCRWGYGSCDSDVPPRCFNYSLFTNQLQQVSLSVKDFANCSAAFEGEGVRLVEEAMFCAGEVGKDTCQGDSGGPVVDGSGTLVGIVSFGISCAADLPGIDGVYTRVSSFLPFLHEQAIVSEPTDLRVLIGAAGASLALFLSAAFLCWRQLSHPASISGAVSARAQDNAAKPGSLSLV